MCKSETIKFINARIKQNLEIKLLGTINKNIPSYSQFVKAMKVKKIEEETIKRYANKWQV